MKSGRMSVKATLGSFLLFTGELNQSMDLYCNKSSHGTKQGRFEKGDRKNTQYIGQFSVSF